MKLSAWIFQCALLACSQAAFAAGTDVQAWGAAPRVFSATPLVSDSGDAWSSPAESWSQTARPASAPAAADGADAEVNVISSPVPEANVYTLLLAGVAMLAYMSRRRD